MISIHYVPIGLTSFLCSQKRSSTIGCGGGILAESLAQRGAQVTGIDMGDTPLGVAKLHQLESEPPVRLSEIHC